MEKIKSLYEKLKENVSLAVVGREEAVGYLTAALLCGGHVIITDVPGTGKTLLTKAFASSLSLSFRAYSSRRTSCRRTLRAYGIST